MTYATGNKERKVNYSDMGNAIDLSSVDGSPPTYREPPSEFRYDSMYPQPGNNGGW